MGDNRFPWGAYRQFCLGVLGWSPREFREATIWEVADAYDGYAQKNGIRREPRGGLTGEKVGELKRWMESLHGDA